jgi:chemotaxis protein CheX
MDARPGKPFIKGTQVQPIFDIAGVLEPRNDYFRGQIALCFPGSLYVALLSNMLGEEPSTLPNPLTDELQDGAAELLNIIFGHVRAALSEEGHRIESVRPRVLRGVEIQDTAADLEVIVIPFETHAGKFQIEIAPFKKEG